jgi:hypothetical protein
MFKVLMVLILACGFVACNEDDIAKLVEGDPIPLTVGFYESNCIVDGADSYDQILEVISQTEVSLDETEYVGVTDCSTAGTSPGAANVAIELADFSYADTVSFFAITGEDEARAYHISEGVLYLGEVKKGITSENAASSFSAFIADPKGEAELIFTPFTPPII